MIQRKTIYMKFFSLPVFFFLILSSQLFAQENETKVFNLLWGVKGGYSQIVGHYDNEFNDSFTAGVYTFPVIFKYFMGEFDLNFSMFPLSNNSESALYSLSFSLGPLGYYSILPYFQIYAGIAGQGNYLYLKADKSDKDERTFKPGFIAKGGFFFPLISGFRLRTGIEYNINPLSGKSFENVKLIAGASYNFSFTGPSDRPVIIQVVREDPKIKKADEIYKKGINSLGKKNYLNAKKLFEDVIDIIPEHEGALYYLSKIKNAEGHYKKALKHSNNKEYYKTIDHLVKSSDYIKEASKQLNNIRKRLKKKNRLLEKNALEFYRKKNYKRCITVTKTILLVDPKNKFAQLYLNRAKKRYRAIEKFK